MKRLAAAAILSVLVALSAWVNAGTTSQPASQPASKPASKPVASKPTTRPIEDIAKAKTAGELAAFKGATVSWRNGVSFRGDDTRNENGVHIVFWLQYVLPKNIKAHDAIALYGDIDRIENKPGNLNGEAMTYRIVHLKNIRAVAP